MKQILGLDLGKRALAIALSDELRMLAHPLETIESSSARRWRSGCKRSWRNGQVDCVVVGLPRQMNGVLGLAAKNAQRFVEKLRLACFM